MTCKKDSSWMTEVMSGGLRLELEAELLAHKAECVECSKEFANVKALRAAIDRGVEAMVAGEPSPQFIARLRAGIAEEPTRSIVETWAPAIAGAFALAALLAFWMLRSPHRDSAGPSPESAPKAAVVLNPPQSAPPTSRAPWHTNGPVHSGPVRRLEPDVEVPPGQVASFLRFGEALQNHRVNGEQLVAAQQELEKPLEVKAIDIPPLDSPSLAEGPAVPKDDAKF